MINKLIIAKSESNNPYLNLAYEEYLFNTLPEDAFILYLWQNDNTVVIGLNQNALRECDIRALKESGGYLARRKTGGGAVYHDKNNLNFTYIAHNADYDVERQYNIIRKALKGFGIHTGLSGRNDLTAADGRKFSGSAFLKREEKCLHHGTLLLDTDTEKMLKYLTVNREKLQSKGVLSVRSRVVNLKEINNAITTEKVKEALIDAAKDIIKAKIIEFSDVKKADRIVLKRLETEYRNEKFIIGDRLKFQAASEKRFQWGTARVEFNIEKGIIESLKVYTDSLDTTLSARIESALYRVNLEKEDFEDKAVDDIYKLIKYGG